jgi:hypothetical protein
MPSSFKELGRSLLGTPNALTDGGETRENTPFGARLLREAFRHGGSMHYDFDAVIDRRGTYSSKWESAALRRGAGRNGERQLPVYQRGSVADVA